MKALFIYLLLFVVIVSKSQTNKHDTINEVIIVERRVHNEAGANQSIKPTELNYFQQSSLQQLLQIRSNVFVKNYGVGGLSTISIRGSSAAQTQVLWNGMNINNASTGLSDFNSIPVSFFEDIQIAYGSDINHQGMGGAVKLANSKPIFINQYHSKFAMGYESLQNLSASYQTTFSNRHYENKISINASRAENRYNYFNEELQQKIKLDHALSHQINIMNDIAFKILDHHIISWHVWLQDLNREIPAAEFEDVSAKTEHIQPLRSVVTYELENFNRIGITSSIGCFYERYQYQDSLINLSSKMNVLNIPFQTSFRWKPFRYQQLSAQINANHAQLIPTTEAQLNKAGLLLSYSFENILKRIQLKVSALQEVSPQFNIPLSGSIHISDNKLRWLKPYLSLSKNNRLPTLNELYYFPGGNPLLKPERSRNIEGGVNTKKDYYQHHLQVDLTFFHRNVNNWIAWYGSSILTPHNIQRVESKGMEVIANYEFHISGFQERYPNRRNLDSAYEELIMPVEVEVVAASKRKKIHTITAGLFYAYTLSTTQESLIPNDYSIGKQIPYVPRYQMKANLGIIWNQFECSYNHTYTGYRFVTTDESVYLKPYHSGQLFCSYQTRILKKESQLTLRLNNIWNARVESIVGRVMPGRNASLSWMIKFR